MSSIQRIKGGNSTAELYRITSNGTSKILKIGRTARAKAEIKENVEGYRTIKKEGLEQILPEEITIGSMKCVDFILMSDLGSSFMDDIKKTNNPQELYSNLICAIQKIYAQSLKADNQGKEFLQMISHQAEQKYREFLIPAGISNYETLDAFMNFNLERLISDKTCFAVFDFTPEDIFLVNGQIKYPDAAQTIRGIPIIDLACFAGTSRDVYNLPGSIRGYQALHVYATDYLSLILDINKENAEKLFAYGRALQMAISAKVRIESNPAKAVIYANESRRIIMQYK